jgi:hypothetical protein
MLGFRATQVRRRRGNEAHRRAKAGLRALSRAAARSRRLFSVHMAKELRPRGVVLLVVHLASLLERDFAIAYDVAHYAQALRYRSSCLL